MARPLLLGSIGVAILAAAWMVFTTPEQVAVGVTCEPRGIVNSVRSGIQGARFWRSQAARIDQELAWLGRRGARRAAIDSVGFVINTQTRAFLDSTYKQYPELRPTPAETMSAGLRQRADSIEFAQLDSTVNSWTVEYMHQLESCRGVVLHRAGYVQAIGNGD